jgi:hypothetical protein
MHDVMRRRVICHAVFPGPARGRLGGVTQWEGARHAQAGRRLQHCAQLPPALVSFACCEAPACSSRWRTRCAASDMVAMHASMQHGAHASTQQQLQCKAGIHGLCGSLLLACSHPTQVGWVDAWGPPARAVQPGVVTIRVAAAGWGRAPAVRCSGVLCRGVLMKRMAVG